MGAPDDESGSAHSRRVAQWARDSAEFRPDADVPDGDDAAQALMRYRRSRTTVVRLPHPLFPASRHRALDEGRRQLARRVAILLILEPLLVVLAVVVEPLALQLAIGALALVDLGVVVHHRSAVRAIDRERHITLHGGLADAWSDWLVARERLAVLDDASQARAALDVNEDRMRTLVAALGTSAPQPETDQFAASEDWVYRSAATAGALVAAEQRLELERRQDVDAGILAVAPDGDLDALQHALDNARALGSLPDGTRRPPSL